MSTSDEQVRTNTPAPVSMRAPAEAQGNFALESAMDELASALGMDPLELRLRNYADVHPALNLPWTSKALRECYTVPGRRCGVADGKTYASPTAGSPGVTTPSAGRATWTS